MSHLVISSEIVAGARMSLPPAHSTTYNVMDIEVLAADGQPAVIEFERIPVRHEDGGVEWSWEAMTCWALIDEAL
jgi:hypothetical protein